MSDERKTKRQLIDELVELRSRIEELEASEAGHRRVEEGLRASEERYRLLFAQSPDAVVVIDPETTQAIDCNEQVLQLLGYSRDEFLKLRISDYEALESPEDVRAHIEKVLGRGIDEFETKMRSKDGQIKDVHVSIRVVEIGGRVVFHNIFRDVTERKRAEEKLQKAHQELQEACAKLERAQATAIASEKLAALGRLTAGVSHEVLNPLNVITITLHLLMDDPDTPPKIVNELSVLLGQAKRIAKISQDLLYFARQRPPQRRRLDFGDIVQRTIGLLEHELRLKDIKVELRVDENIPQILADEDQIQQVVFNLVSNAKDATPGGSRITLRTTTEPPRVKDEVESVVLRVEDMGPGIPSECMDKLFEPFFTTKPEGEGTGLGLAICLGIVESHGGSIWAENLPGGGAAFSVRLGTC